MRKLRRSLVLIVAVVAVFGAGYLILGGTPEESPIVGTPSAVAQPEVPEDEPVAQVASTVGPSAVEVDVPGANGERGGVGSGVIYREDGYVVTNNHVVRGAGEVEIVFADGSRETGEVVGGDEVTDLAVVRVDRNDLPAANLADSGGLVVGQMAVAIGSPQGLQSTVTAGVVSGLNRELPPELTGGAQSALVDLIQTDAPISPGNSGGALANRDGEVIGINVAYLPPGQTGADSIGFAIPSNTVSQVADQLIENGEAVHPYLGISLGDLTPEAAEQFGLEADAGAVVGEVIPGEPAAQAGVEVEDVIVAIDSEEVESSGDLLSALRRYAPGDTVTLTVLRNGEEIDLQVRLGEREN